MPIGVSGFLAVYTRTRDRDYSWSCPAVGLALIPRLEEHVLTWTSAIDLRDGLVLHAYFRLERTWHVLAQARRSPRRVDRVGRPIMERVALLWKEGASLVYGHLVPLMSYLDSLANEFLSAIDQEEAVQREGRCVDVDLDELDAAFPVDANVPLWTLAGGHPTPATIHKLRLTLCLPPGMGFVEVLQPILRQSLEPPDGGFSVAAGITSPLAFCQKTHGIFSPTRSLPDWGILGAEVVVLDERATCLSPLELDKMLRQAPKPTNRKSEQPAELSGASDRVLPDRARRGAGRVFSALLRPPSRKPRHEDAAPEASLKSAESDFLDAIPHTSCGALPAGWRNLVGEVLMFGHCTRGAMLAEWRRRAEALHSVGISAFQEKRPALVRASARLRESLLSFLTRQ